MDYFDFLNIVIDKGIEAAKESYKNDSNRCSGAVAGFEACRNKSPEELLEIYRELNPYQTEASENRNIDEYWWFQCYQSEVEWVCNLVSALLVMSERQPLFSWLPTVNGYTHAIKIINGKLI